jgi:hypothetical protein
MTSLRQRMLEDLEIRNYAPATVECYVRSVAEFAKHFNRSPDQLGPEEIRSWQLFLIREKRVKTSMVNPAIGTAGKLARYDEEPVGSVSNLSHGTLRLFRADSKVLSDVRTPIAESFPAIPESGAASCPSLHPLSQSIGGAVACKSCVRLRMPGFGAPFSAGRDCDLLLPLQVSLPSRGPRNGGNRQTRIPGNQPFPGVSENGIWLCFALRGRAPPKHPDRAARTRRTGGRRPPAPP